MTKKTWNNILFVAMIIAVVALVGYVVMGVVIGNAWDAPA